MILGIRFGPAGASDSFSKEKGKTSLDMPKWLHEHGLNAFEYQCGHGVRIGEEKAAELGRRGEDWDVRLSVHAPYYINLSTMDPDIRVKTQNHLMKSLRVAQAMKATTVVFHPGAGSKGDRREALLRAKGFLAEIMAEARDEGLGEIILAPETMGKKNQLGSLEEVLELCELGGQVRPAIDFGHLHAVTGGALVDKAAFAQVLDLIQSRLGQSYLENLHVHFSPIEFTAGGEKKHRTTLDEGIGPEFAPLAELLVERKMSPVIICESAGRQAEDAVFYRGVYEQLMHRM